MQLIIDSNVIMSALIANGATRMLIFNSELVLFAPEHTLAEIEKHKTELLKKSKMKSDSFDLLLSLILNEISVIEKKEYEEYIKEATDLLSDKDDAPFLALAMNFNCGIWSNDRGLKEDQKKVVVHTTAELLSTLKI